MNRKSYVHQISEISLMKQVRVRSCAVMSERRCIVVDWRCRESEGKVKIEGYMSVSDEEAHQRVFSDDLLLCILLLKGKYREVKYEW